MPPSLAIYSKHISIPSYRMNKRLVVENFYFLMRYYDRYNSNVNGIALKYFKESFDAECTLV